MTEEGELDRSEAGKHQEVYKNLGEGNPRRDEIGWGIVNRWDEEDGEKRRRVDEMEWVPDNETQEPTSVCMYEMY